MRVPTGVFGSDGPVEQRREVALVVADAVADEVRSHLDAVRTRVRYASAAAVASLGLAVALAVTGPASVAAVVGVAGVVGSVGYAWWSFQSDPDAQVIEAEKRYWTGYVVPQPNGSFVYDATGTVVPTELEVEQFGDMSLLADGADSFADEFELPVVQTDECDVEAAVRNRLAATRSQVRATETVQFEAPIADTTGEVAAALESLPVDSAVDDVRTDTVEFDLSEATAQADRIRETETMALESDPDRALADLKTDSADLVDTLTTTKTNAVRRLNEHVDVAGEITSMASHNFYCPDCIEDDVYSRLDLEFGDGPQWFCETCRDRFGPADDPVPKHRLKDELVEEVWDRLWIEKDDERRRIYENIEDQKADLEEREFEQRQEAIRTAWDRIRDRRSKVRDLETEAKAERGAITEIGRVMEKYDRLAAERRQAFEADVADAMDRIEEETRAAIEEMRNYEEEKIEESQQEARERAELARIEEQKRHQEKMAKLDGIKKAQEELLDHEKTAHEREMLMDARGGTSMSSVMNSYHMKKGKLFGFSKGE